MVLVAVSTPRVEAGEIEVVGQEAFSADEGDRILRMVGSLMGGRAKLLIQREKLERKRTYFDSNPFAYFP